MEEERKENNIRYNYKNQETTDTSKKEIIIRIPCNSSIQKFGNLIEKCDSLVEKIMVENVYVTINYLTINDKHTENK